MIMEVTLIFYILLLIINQFLLPLVSLKKWKHLLFYLYAYVVLSWKFARMKTWEKFARLMTGEEGAPPSLTFMCAMLILSFILHTLLLL